MGAIIKLFGADGFDIAMTLLIDEDARDETAKKLGVDPADVEASGHFTSDPDLEAEYIAALGAADMWSTLSTSGLFSKNQLANCDMNGPGGVPDEAELRTFIHKYKHKVRAAMAVAKVLDDATARKIVSVDAVLTKIAGA